MKHRYEALLVLNTKGSEEGEKEIIERLEAELRHDGATVEQIQKLGRHQFSYPSAGLDSGFYVNFLIEAEPAVIGKLKSRFKLDEKVHLQHYQRLRTGRAKKAQPVEEKVATEPASA